MSKIKLLIALLCISTFVKAQLNVNSPYSRFGLGNIQHPASAFNIGMAGVGISYTNPNSISTLNPSLLTYITKPTFELGAQYVGLLVTEGDLTNTSANFQFSYFNMAFPISPKYTFGFSLRPYSQVNYSTTLSNQISPEAITNDRFEGAGSINTIGFTNGYQIVDDTLNKVKASIGFETSLLVGNIQTSASTETVIINDLRTEIINDLSYRGFQLRLGSSLRKELFQGKALKKYKTPICKSKGEHRDTLILRDNFFYKDYAKKIGEKSIKTKYAVIYPNTTKIILSNKIKDVKDRRKIRDSYASFIEKGYGVFILEEAIGVSLRELEKDYKEGKEESESNIEEEQKINYAKKYVRKQSGVFVNLGLVYEFQSRLNINGTRTISRQDISVNEAFQTFTIDTDNDFSIVPQALNLGISIDKPRQVGKRKCGDKKKSTWLLGADLSLYEWSSFSSPDIVTDFRNTYRVSLGGGWTPNPNPDLEESAKFFKKTRYRAGLYYQTLPFDINNSDISEFGITFGITLPSTLGGKFNINMSYARRGEELIENYFTTGIGITLNQRSWFRRRKVGI